MDAHRHEFRNGLPMRLFGWLQLKVGKLYKKKVSRFVKLNGEVLSIHSAEHTLPTDEFDIYGALVEYSRSPSKRDFRVSFGKRALTIMCGSHEEMITWASSMEFAARRSFYDAYNLAERIAEGTYSKVYRCIDVVSPTSEFVVKVVSRKHADFEALKWLERERHINTVVAHRCVVRAVDMFANLENVHIVFEYMRGGTVRDLLNSHKKLGESYARAIMRELLLALHYLHSKNIVHRDVRPDNLFCSHLKFPMAIALGDFGYANFFSDKVVNQDVLTTIIGTPPYTAAEICRREKYGPPVDLWSAGVTMYEILSGTVPFQGRNVHESNQLTIRAQLSFNGKEWNNVSGNAKKLIRQLLQPDPHKRISALAALQHAWFGAAGASLQTTPSAQRLITPSESTRALMHSESARSLVQRNAELDNFTGNKADRDLSPTTSSGDEADDDADSANGSRDAIRPPRGLVRNAQSLRSGPRGMHRVGSTASSGIGAGRPWSTGQPKLTHAASQPTLQHTLSLSSLSSGAHTQSRMAMTPSMQRIQEVGLELATKENPARMRAFLKSPVVKSQLSSMFVMRRRLIVTSRALVAVFRMRALVRGQSLTRNLSRVGSVKEVDVDVAAERRQQAENVAASRKLDSKSNTPNSSFDANNKYSTTTTTSSSRQRSTFNRNSTSTTSTTSTHSRDRTKLG